MKKSIFQELVEESIVLLKNEGQILPLKEKKVAFLGRAQAAVEQRRPAGAEGAVQRTEQGAGATRLRKGKDL